MRTFIATLVLTAFVSAQDEAAEWSLPEKCLATAEEILRWYATTTKDGKIFPNQTAAGQEWSAEQIKDYDDAILVLQNWPTGLDAEPQAEADLAAAIAAESLDNLSWLDADKKALADADILLMTGYPTIPDYFEAECVEPAAEEEEISVETWGLTNMHDAMPITEFTTTAKADIDGDPDVVTKHGSIQGRTGWYNVGGGSDAELIYQFALEYTESPAVKKANAGGVGNTRVALIWANDGDAEAMEIDEFGNLGALAGNFFLTMRQKMIAAPTPATEEEKEAEDFVEPTPQTIAGVTGYAPIDETKSKFSMFWQKPVTEGMPYSEGPLSAYAKGGWAPEQSLTQWLGGWEDTPTAMKWRMVMTKSADNLGGLTNVKQGGKVHLVAGYKPDKAATEFAAKTDHVEIKWAEEPASEEGGEGGEISKGDEKTEDVDDGATSVTTFGAAVLAAISALAF